MIRVLNPLRCGLAALALSASLAQAQVVVVAGSKSAAASLSKEQVSDAFLGKRLKSPFYCTC